jgi:nondiscriminating glutamyl-tRNA synthetase
MVRVRFAPSPTGNLHLGTVRTALFNWIFARQTEGTIVLRIEDTDRQRSQPEFEENICLGIQWLGLDMDRPGPFGPYRQSERMAEGLYQKYSDQLVTDHKAYLCFCSEEDLDRERVHADEAKIPYVYSRKCASLSEEEISKKLSDGRPHTVRFRMPDQNRLIFHDLIRGNIKIGQIPVL